MDLRVDADRSSSAVNEVSAFRGLRLSRAATVVLFAAIEASLVALCAPAAQALFELSSGRPVNPDIVASIGVVAAGLYLAAAHAFQLYHLAQLLAPRQGRVVAVSASVILLLTANLFVLKAGAEVSRGFIVTFSIMLTLTACLSRVAMAAVLPKLIASHLIAGRPAVLVGMAEELDLVMPRDLFRNYGLSEVGRITLSAARGSGTGWSRVVANEAMRVARSSRGEEFVLAMPWGSERLNQLEDELRHSPLAVRLLPDGNVRTLLGRHGAPERDPLRLIDLQRAPMSALDQTAKRALDLVLALGSVCLLSPILVAAAFAVKLESPGPVIFRQRRNGFIQREFTILKFRTMTVLEDGDIQQARRGDARVTRVGQFLRRTSIDELPQLFNVIRGDMSLVGPRPHALVHDAQYQPLIRDYFKRHHVKPGITGWAQVNGLRGETRDTERMQRRITFDIFYINNWSIGLDLRILLRTCLEVLSHDAY